MSIYNNAFTLFRDVLFQDHEAWTSLMRIISLERQNTSGVSYGKNEYVGSGGLFKGGFFEGGPNRGVTVLSTDSIVGM